MSDVVFVDTETTGLHEDMHEVWEVALIDGEREYVWHLGVNLAWADPFALEMTGFYSRHLDYRNVDEEALPSNYSRVSEAQFAEQFVDLTVGKHLAGAVVSFDEERIRKMVRQFSLQPRWHYHIIDVEALALGYINGKPGKEPIGIPWKSDDLSLAVGVVPSRFERHTALGDARWAKAIYEAVMS